MEQAPIRRRRGSRARHRPRWGASALACLLGAAGCSRTPPPPGAELVPVPAGTNVLGSRETGASHPPRPWSTEGFQIGRTEVTVTQYARFLTESGSLRPAAVPDAIRREGDVFEARAGRADLPVAQVSLGDARAYCAWLSGLLQRPARLPTEDEWEYAARGGIDGARHPWGWGPPAGRACFAASGPAPAASGAPNPYGLLGMAGNVYEWCEPADPDGRAPARGGGWSEKDPAYLRVFHRVVFPADYRGADVGFRVVASAGDDPAPPGAAFEDAAPPSDAGGGSPRLPSSTIASCSRGTNSCNVLP